MLEPGSPPGPLANQQLFYSGSAHFRALFRCTRPWPSYIAPGPFLGESRLLDRASRRAKE